DDELEIPDRPARFVLTERTINRADACEGEHHVHISLLVQVDVQTDWNWTAWSDLRTGSAGAQSEAQKRQEATRRRASGKLSAAQGFDLHRSPRMAKHVCQGEPWAASRLSTQSWKTRNPRGFVAPGCLS